MSQYEHRGRRESIESNDSFTPLAGVQVVVGTGALGRAYSFFSVYYLIYYNNKISILN